MDQATIIMNLMLKPRSDQNLSAHDQLFGIFNFNDTPFAPPVTRMMVHDKPKKEQHILLMDNMDGALAEYCYTTDASNVK